MPAKINDEQEENDMRKQEIKERCCIGLAILAYLSGIASLVLVSGTVKCGIVMLVLEVLLLLCSYQKGRGVTAMEVAAIVIFFRGLGVSVRHGTE